MRVRRTFSTPRPSLARFLGWLRPGHRAKSPPSEPPKPPTPPPPAAPPSEKRPRRRRWSLLGWTFVIPLVLGYLLAAVVLFPAPLFTASQTMPQLIGSTEGEAREIIEQERLFLANVDEVAHPSAPRGVVVWQDPPAGVVVPQGTPVQFSVSSGPQRIPVPDVAGYDMAIAIMLIESAGLTVRAIDSVQTAAPKNVTVNTRPPAGTPRAPGLGVTLVVSVGAPTISVPDLTGMTVEEAEAILVEAGLVLGTFWRETSSAQEPGNIFKQAPEPETLTAPGTPVNVVLAQRP